nr:hypothetical protein [Achromobacter sp.]
MWLAFPDLRQTATRLHAAIDRRRARPALGPHSGHNGLIPRPHPHHDSFRRLPRATPRRHPHRANRQRPRHRHRMALSAWW